MKEPIRNFKCPDCGKMVVNAHALKIHRMFRHDGKPASVKATPTKELPPANNESKPDAFDDFFE